MNEHPVTKRYAHEGYYFKSETCVLEALTRWYGANFEDMPLHQQFDLIGELFKEMAVFTNAGEIEEARKDENREILEAVRLEPVDQLFDLTERLVKTSREEQELWK